MDVLTSQIGPIGNFKVCKTARPSENGSQGSQKMKKMKKNFLGSNGLISAPTFPKSSQHTIMILYSRIFAFFCIALDALRTYVDDE